MIDGYLQGFGQELERCGISGRDRRRVLAETEDHLRELSVEHGERGALTRFGESRELARQIAAQLATTKTIRSTYGAFAALSLTGLGYVGFLAFIDHGGWPDLFSGDHEAIGVLAAVGLILFPQIAFVSGGLALLRALRLRAGLALPAEELSVLRRRSAVALASGGLTVVSMTVWAIEFRELAPILALSFAAALPLSAGTVALIRASAPHAVPAGSAGDVFDDLHLEGLRPHPWRLALLAAAVVALIGLVFGSPIHAAFEAFALLGCFALLGRRLALRP